jgi:hypothetical protein
MIDFINSLHNYGKDKILHRALYQRYKPNIKTLWSELPTQPCVQTRRSIMSQNERISEIRVDRNSVQSGEA